MTKYKIYSRYSPNKLIFTGDCLRGADLRDANLSYADLSCADLSGANLSGVNLIDAIGIRSLTTERWSVYITSIGIQIGCQYHTPEQWKTFKKKDIKKMSARAWKWWKKYRKIIFKLAETLEK